MYSYLAQPYPCTKHTHQHSLLVAVGTGVFVGLFLIVFQPFGASQWLHPYKNLLLAGYGVITCVTLLLINYIGKSVFPTWYNEKDWTVGREIVHNMLVILFIALGNVLYTYYLGLSGISALSVLTWVGVTLAIGIIPATVITLINYTRLLRQHVTTNLRIGQPTSVPSPHLLTLVAENDKDTLTVPGQDLLFIESADNYAEVVFWKNGTLEKKLLRSSLSRIEEQITGPDILRCHRSYIVNLRQVESITGNAQGYRLQLKNEGTLVPVARRYGDRVKAYFQK